MLHVVLSKDHRNRRQHRPYRKRTRRVRRGRVAAAVRAFAGAHIRLGMPITAKTLQGAAEMTGSCVHYIEAATTVLQAEDAALMTQVLRGNVSLLDAAKAVKKRVKLMRAYHDASDEDRIAVVRINGVSTTSWSRQPTRRPSC
jgi:hypothetical protein